MAISVNTPTKRSPATKRKKQAYTKKWYSTYLLEKKYDKNIFFLPKKASPNPIKSDYLKTKCLPDRQNVSILLQYKLDELRDKADFDFNCIGHEFAHSASGRIWDDKLAKMCSYWGLINHLNPNICAKWLKSGKNEFGRLFWGFKPDDIKGTGVLDWIKKLEVPIGKKVTYPQYTFDVWPEKDEPD